MLVDEFHLVLSMAFLATSKSRHSCSHFTQALSSSEEYCHREKEENNDRYDHMVEEASRITTKLKHDILMEWIC